MRRHAWLGLFLFTFFLPQNLEASFIDALGVGARAMAMGSAYTAVSDDLTAIYYNPAGLAQIEDHQIMLGYIWSNPRLKESSAADPYFQAERVIPYHLKAPLVALGFNLDRTFKGKVPIHARIGVMNSAPNNFKSIYQVWDPEVSVPRWVRFGDYWDRVYLMAGLSLQADKIPWLSLGVGFRFLISGTQYLMDRHGTPGLDLLIDHISIPLQGKVEANIDFDVDTETSPTVGVMLTPTKNLRLGYCFHNSLSQIVSPLKAQAQARIVLNGQELIELPLALSISFEGYYWPQQHNWGVSYLWGERLLLSVDLSLFRWSKFTSASRGAPDPGWNDSLVPRIGIEFLPVKDLALRCGYFFEPSPLPDQSRASNYMDNDRHAFSVGAGYTFSDPLKIVRKPMTLDLAFQYIYMPTRETQKNTGFFPDHSYEANGEIFTVGGNITFRF